MLTTIDVVVEELCSNTVPRIPIIRPATGLDRISFSPNALPAALPGEQKHVLLSHFLTLKLE